MSEDSSRRKQDFLVLIAKSEKLFREEFQKAEREEKFFGDAPDIRTANMPAGKIQHKKKTNKKFRE